MRRPAAGGGMLLAAALALALTGCSSTSPDRSDDTWPGTSPPSLQAPEWVTEEEVAGELVVFAAASLRGVFEELGELLRTWYPNLHLTFSFASSTTLADQVASGAPADVLATANETAMTRAAGAVVNPEAFASNTLVIVTAPGNPTEIGGLTDFTNADLTLAVCAEQVPCGSAAAAAFTAAGVAPSIDTYGENVTATLNLVTSGEADAALVYRTDAQHAASSVAEVIFPEADQATTTDWIALTTDAPNPQAAQLFLDLVASSDGLAALAEAGFGEP